MNDPFTSKTLLAVLAALWFAFMPMQSTLIAVVVLPLFDLFLALAVAFKEKWATVRWYSCLSVIESAGIKRSVAKITLYLIGAIMAFIAETWLTGPVIPCVKVVTGLVGVTELKSCLEHLDNLGGGQLFKQAISALAPGHDKDGNEKV